MQAAGSVSQMQEKALKKMYCSLKSLHETHSAKVVFFAGVGGGEISK